MLNNDNNIITSEGGLNLAKYIAEHSAYDNDKKTSIKQKFLRIIEESGLVGFVDEDNNVYFKINGIVKSSCSTSIKAYFADSFFRNFGELLTDKHQQDYKNFLVNICLSLSERLGVKKEIFNRVAMYNGNIYISLTNKASSIVEISKSGCRFDVNPPVIFTSEDSSKDLPVVTQQVSKYEINRLKRFVNCDKEDFKLLICFLVNSLFPENYGGGKAILILTGQPGTGKSTFISIIKSLIDPNKNDCLDLEENTRDLLLSARRQWLVAFDNVSKINRKQSDTLCKISTKASVSWRKLFTDGEVFSFSIKRPMILNGISDIIERSDLIDRCIFLNPEVINDIEGLNKFKENFEKERPIIFGALLSIMSEVLEFIANEDFKPVFRLADFDIISQAVEKSLDWDKGEFHKAYKNNLRVISVNSLHGDIVAISMIYCIKDLLDKSDNGTFSHTCRTSVWHKMAQNLFLKYEKRPLPINNPAEFGNKLKYLMKTFAKIGINFEPKRSNGSVITISGDIEKIDKRLFEF